LTTPYAGRIENLSQNDSGPASDRKWLIRSVVENLAHKLAF